MIALVGATKRCAHCEQTKDVSLFYAKSGRPGQFHAWCKACLRTYYKAKGSAYNNKYQNQLRKDKRAFVRDYAVQVGCADCGERHEACLEFHHLNPKVKHREVSKMTAGNASLARIQAEMAKCVVLCSNCHRIRHFNERRARKLAIA